MKAQRQNDCAKDAACRPLLLTWFSALKSSSCSSPARLALAHARALSVQKPSRKFGSAASSRARKQPRTIAGKSACQATLDHGNKLPRTCAGSVHICHRLQQQVCEHHHLVVLSLQAAAASSVQEATRQQPVDVRVQVPEELAVCSSNPRARTQRQVEVAHVGT